MRELGRVLERSQKATRNGESERCRESGFAEGTYERTNERAVFSEVESEEGKKGLLALLPAASIFMRLAEPTPSFALVSV